jgi:hypothetical protein
MRDDIARFRLDRIDSVAHLSVVASARKRRQRMECEVASGAVYVMKNRPTFVARLSGQRIVMAEFASRRLVFSERN